MKWKRYLEWCGKMKKILSVSVIVIAVLLLALSAFSVRPGSFNAFYSQQEGISMLSWLVIVFCACCAVISAVRHRIKTAGGFGLVGVGVAIWAFFASVGSNITFECATNKLFGYLKDESFMEETKEMATFPLPGNEEGSSAYKKCLKWIHEETEKNHLFDGKKVDFNNAKFQEILKEAIIIFGRDMQNTVNSDEKINDLTFLSLLHFQCGSYQDSYTYAYEAQNRQDSATLAHCIYATTCLYSEKAARDNLRIQKKHLVPALIREGDNKFTPFALRIYLDRLMYRIHGGKSKPEELLFMFDLLKEKSFSKNAPYCISNLTERIVQELNQSQKDVETLSRCDNNNLPFLRNNNALEVLDIRYKNFVGLKDILKQLLPYIMIHEKNLGEDLTFANVQGQLKEFNIIEPKLKALIAETKNRISSSCETP